MSAYAIPFCSRVLFHVNEAEWVPAAPDCSSALSFDLAATQAEQSSNHAWRRAIAARLGARRRPWYFISGGLLALGTVCAAIVADGTG